MTQERNELTDRLMAVERQLAYLYGHLGLDLEAAEGIELPMPAEITALVQAGKDVPAIKAYREAFGADLADATRAIKRLRG